MLRPLSFFLIPKKKHFPNLPIGFDLTRIASQCPADPSARHGAIALRVVGLGVRQVPAHWYMEARLRELPGDAPRPCVVLPDPVRATQ